MDIGESLDTQSTVINLDDADECFVEGDQVYILID